MEGAYSVGGARCEVCNSLEGVEVYGGRVRLSVLRAASNAREQLGQRRGGGGLVGEAGRARWPG